MLDIYRRAVSYFGATKQKLKAIEEMAELIVELVKDLLGDGNPAKVIEELAGLFVMDANENNDAALTYAKAKRDELILSIVGPELFVPFDQIYGDAYIDEAKRIRIRMKETDDG